MRLGVLAACLASCTAGCEPTLLVGKWTCGAQNAPGREEPVIVPWSTGFEDGFCDYERSGGFCYSDEEDAAYSIVTSPARSGGFAAAFTVGTKEDDPGAQARCVVQGGLPTEAHYSAWYYVPEAPRNRGNWNLFHFEEHDGETLEARWDVSISSDSDSTPTLYIFDHVRGIGRSGEDTPPMPVGRWFQVELYLDRQDDATGAIALYQDGELLVEVTGLRTGVGEWGQWYVGNLADDLTPATSTVYVDDVTITPVP